MMAKNTIYFLFIFFITSNLYSQNHNIIGAWSEYKRTVLNGEDGSKYTFNSKPFIAEFQLQFLEDSNKVVFFDGNNINNGVFFIDSDTLTIEKHVPMAKSVFKSKEKYIILNSKEELVLIEFKPKLDESYLIRKFYFKKLEKFTILSEKGGKPFSIPDKLPTFIGGQDSLNFFIKKNIKYPENLKRMGVTGKVILKLTIDEIGSVANVEIMSNPKLEFAQEAMRVIRMMPSWEPGSQKGENVKTYYNLPISFTLR